MRAKHDHPDHPQHVTEAELRRALTDAGCRDVDEAIRLARETGANVMVGGKLLKLVDEEPSSWHG